MKEAIFNFRFKFPLKLDAKEDKQAELEILFVAGNVQLEILVEWHVNTDILMYR